MKKILIVYSGFVSNGGGVVTHAKNLKSIIEEIGYSCEIFSMNDLPFFVRYLFPFLERLINLFSTPKGFVIRMKLTKKYFEKFLSIEYNHYFFEDVYTTPEKFLHKSNIFIHSLKTDNLQSFKKISNKECNKLSLWQKSLIDCNKNKIFIVSEQYKDRIECLYNIKDLEVFNNFLCYETEKLNFSGDKENNILFVGNLETRKSPLFLINVFKILSKKNINYNMFFIGKEKDIKIKHLNELIQEYKLEDRVKVLGMLKHNEVLEYMKKSKIFALPSLQETFGYVFLEAKICGCKVIANENLTVPKDLIDYELPLESEKWANTIIKLLNQESSVFQKNMYTEKYNKNNAINKLKQII